MSGSCLACERTITGRAYTFDGVGPYCVECCRTRPPCDVCGAPLSRQSWQLSDGRVICAQCHATAVFSPQAAAELYDDLKEVIFSMLDLKLNIPTGLALVDRIQLRRVIERQSGLHPPGRIERSDAAARPLAASTLDVENTLGIYARRGIRRGIYIQTGLPRLLFLQIAAHEYAHAWQGENSPLIKDPLVHEGFAEWVAYRVVGHYGYRRSQERMLARQDVYGSGLRWALEVEARQGPEEVIRLCRQPQGSD